MERKCTYSTQNLRLWSKQAAVCMEKKLEFESVSSATRENHRRRLCGVFHPYTIKWIVPRPATSYSCSVVQRAEARERADHSAHNIRERKEDYFTRIQEHTFVLMRHREKNPARWYHPSRWLETWAGKSLLLSECWWSCWCWLWMLFLSVHSIDFFSSLLSTSRSALSCRRCRCRTTWLELSSR